MLAHNGFQDRPIRPLWHPSVVDATDRELGLTKGLAGADIQRVPGAARACPTCGFIVGASKRFCARCGSRVAERAPVVTVPVAAGAPLDDARFVALGRVNELATADTNQPRRADLLRSVAEHQAPRCTDCGGQPAVPVALRRSRRQTSFLVAIAVSAVALALLRRFERDPAILVGWVFATLGALVVTLPLLPWWRCRTVHSTLCRECAQAQGRIALDRAARSAAIFPPSLLWNLPAISRDVRTLRQIRHVPAASDRKRNAQRAGLPVYLRPGIPLALAGSLAFAWIAQTNAPYRAAQWLGIERSAPWVVGGCVSIPDDGAEHATAVSCALAHDGHILALVAMPDDCPVHTERAVVHRNHYFCIDKRSSY